MERILSSSEKIRRAEEIYARRRGLELEENEEKNSNNSIYKILFRILILINIIISVLCFQNKEDIFKQEFLNKFNEYSNQINQKINSFIMQIKENDENKIEEKKVEETTENEVVADATISTETEQIVENIGDSNEVQEVKEETIPQKIKKSYSFIKPIEGTVTSFFGDRTSAYQNVSGFHNGIDIGAKSGTVIKSAMEGTVSKVSSVGDYRKTYKNRKWRNSNFICTLPKNICKRRRKNITRTRNSRSWKYTGIVQAHTYILK